MNLDILKKYYSTRDKYDNILIYTIHKNIILENKHNILHVYTNSLLESSTINLWKYFLQHTHLTAEDKRACFFALLDHTSLSQNIERKIGVLEKLQAHTPEEFERYSIWSMDSIKDICTHFFGTLITNTTKNNFEKVFIFVNRFYHSSLKTGRLIDEWIEKVIVFNKHFTSIDLNSTLRSDYSETRFLINLFMLMAPFYKVNKLQKVVKVRFIPMLEISVVALIRYRTMCKKYLEIFRSSTAILGLDIFNLTGEIKDLATYKSIEIDYISSILQEEDLKYEIMDIFESELIADLEGIDLFSIYDVIEYYNLINHLPVIQFVNRILCSNRPIHDRIKFTTLISKYKVLLKLSQDQRRDILVSLKNIFIESIREPANDDFTWSQRILNILPILILFNDLWTLPYKTIDSTLLTGEFTSSIISSIAPANDLIRAFSDSSRFYLGYISEAILVINNIKSHAALFLDKVSHKELINNLGNFIYLVHKEEKIKTHPDYHKVIVKINDMIELMETALRKELVTKFVTHENYQFLQNIFINSNKEINILRYYDPDYPAVEVPEDLMDPFNCELIEDPLLLPETDIFVDKVTIQKYIQDNNCNPYNRNPLTWDELLDYNSRSEIKEKTSTMKEKLVEWKKNNYQ